VPHLSTRHRKLLHEALLSAFGSYADLELLLGLELGVSLADICAPQGLPIVAFKVITRAEQEGWSTRLVTAARIRNPGNERLRDLVSEGLLDSEYVVRKRLDDPGDSAARELLPRDHLLDGWPRQQLQKVVNAAVGFHDVVPFAVKLLEQADRVCRVEVIRTSGTVHGTGFLVGPDLVLTNHHVLADLLAGSGSPTGVRCRFDFRIRADHTVDHGIEYGLADQWRIAESQHSAVDLAPAPGQALPAPDELDYALIRLAGTPGAQAVPGRSTRGWLDLTADPPGLKHGLPLLILQHPAGQPIKQALDSEGVLAVNDNGTRVTYGVNTLRGSSGSPCFTWDLQLVALHHAGEPEFGAGRNEGVPIALVAQHLRETGRLPTVGALVPTVAGWGES
jgi:hypothetical protein